MIDVEIEAANNDYEALLIVVRGTFGKSECTLNGRIYPRVIVEREIARAKAQLYEMKLHVSVDVDWSEEYQGL